MEQVTINITEQKDQVTIQVSEGVNQQDVLNTPLSGLSPEPQRVLPSALDSILTAFKKVLKYLSDLGTAAFRSETDFEPAGTMQQHISTMPHYSHLSQLQQDSNYRTVSDAEKTSWNNNIHFKGIYPSVNALEQAHPIANEGDYAFVDYGSGDNAKMYLWDNSDEQWILSSAPQAPEVDPVFTAWLQTNPLQHNHQTFAEKGISFNGMGNLIPVNTEGSFVAPVSGTIRWFIHTIDNIPATCSVDVLLNGISMPGVETKPSLSNQTKNYGTSQNWSISNVVQGDTVTIRIISNINATNLNVSILIDNSI